MNRQLFDEGKFGRIAADVGGTFTDIAIIDREGAITTFKTSSTPWDYADGVLKGMNGVLDALGGNPGQIDEVTHGCTVATNCILELAGARTALLTTKGFRDVLELRRIRVPALYDPLFEKPLPLSPRELRFEIAERVDARGNVVTEIDWSDVDAAIAAIKSSREPVEAIAVCFLHSYANADHERQVGQRLREEFPEMFISLSVDVLPLRKEYERTSTTVVNSYVGPTVEHYLASLVDRVHEDGYPTSLQVMQSTGGLIEAESALRKPAQIVECGPAAGVVAARDIMALSGYDNVVTFDMGGTTAKASVIENGDLTLAEEYEIGGSMSSGALLGGGGGYALSLPVIEISEIGAGGGSIVSLDKANGLKVGPQSAGASPGPACYGLGSDKPTVTDANMSLGYLNNQSLAGGSVKVDRGLSEKAIMNHLGWPLGLAVDEAAYGVHQVANANMMKALRAVTTYRGRDPRDFVLCAFGGNGGVHGVYLAKAMQIGTVVIPRAAGVFSALGLLIADMEVTESAPYSALEGDADIREMAAKFEELENICLARMEGDASEVELKRIAEMRFAGQAFELPTPVQGSLSDPETLVRAAERFRDAHKSRYGHTFLGMFPVEFVSLRLNARRPSKTKQTRLAPIAPLSAASISHRDVYFGKDHGWIKTQIVQRGHLLSGGLSAPLIVEDYEGTTVVPPDCGVKIDDEGNIIINVAL